MMPDMMGAPPFPVNPMMMGGPVPGNMGFMMGMPPGMNPMMRMGMGVPDQWVAAEGMYRFVDVHSGRKISQSSCSYRYGRP